MWVIQTMMLYYFMFNLFTKNLHVPATIHLLFMFCIFFWIRIKNFPLFVHYLSQFFMFIILKFNSVIILLS